MSLSSGIGKEHSKQVRCPENKSQSDVDGPYAKYVLFVLVLVYIFNYIDRQILSILAEEIKADIGLTDADMGFLGGAAFAVFLAVFGIPLGKLSDVWNRTRVISIGLGFWSLMTALSGMARGFSFLAFCRFGVGVGEASCSPSAYSLMYDYFSPKIRTTIVSIYASGLYIGSGLGLFIGGVVLDAWNAAFPDIASAPFGLKGWQAAFMVVGLPGLLMAYWASTLREPARGQADGIPAQIHPHPFRETFQVLLSLLPVTNLWTLAKGGGGWAAVKANMIAGLIVVTSVGVLVQVAGNAMQWGILGLGVYAAISWMQSLAVRDPVAFGLLMRCKALSYTLVSFVGVNFMAIGIGFWSVPYFQRAFAVSPSEIGAVIGFGFVALGLPGVLIGGLLADRLRKFTSRGKLYVQLGSTFLSLLALLVFLTADELHVAYAGLYANYLVGAMGFGPAASTPVDLVLPRVRGTLTAFIIMVVTLGAFALGPYITGVVSDSIASTGVGEGEALRRAMLWSLLTAVAGMACSIMAIKHIEVDEASLKDRARALGEDI